MAIEIYLLDFPMEVELQQYLHVYSGNGRNSWSTEMFLTTPRIFQEYLKHLQTTSYLAAGDYI